MGASSLDGYRSTLAGSVVFEHLTPAELDLVMQSCRLIDAHPGQLLLSEGAKGDGLYVILDGEVEFFLPERVVGHMRRPTRMRLNVLGAGRCFGEYGVIDDRTSSASVQVLRPARLCFLPTAEFRRITGEHDRIGKVVYANLLRFLVSRLRAKDKELDLVLFVDEPGLEQR
jgi:CRP-like cAMP-binding protein